MEASELKEIIKDKIKSIYGEEFEFSLLELKKNDLILITPFIDNENNLIEIGIFFKEPEKIIISDLGKIKSYLRQLVIKDNKNKLNCSNLNLPNHIGTNRNNVSKKNNSDFDNLEISGAGLNEFYKITTDYENIGSNIKRLLRLLQKIYSLKTNYEKNKIEDSKIILKENINFKYYLKNNFDLNIDKKNNYESISDYESRKVNDYKNNFKYNNISNNHNVRTGKANINRIIDDKVNIDKINTFNSGTDDIKEKNFKDKFINLLRSLNINYKENLDINGISGDKKNFDFVLFGKINKYINLISNPNISDVKNFIKISYADFLDLKSFKNSFCIIFDDKKYPYVCHELKKTNFINILIRKKINFFGYYQDFISIKSYLLK